MFLVRPSRRKKEIIEEVSNKTNISTEELFQLEVKEKENTLEDEILLTGVNYKIKAGKVLERKTNIAFNDYSKKFRGSAFANSVEFNQFKALSSQIVDSILVEAENYLKKKSGMIEERINVNKYIKKEELENDGINKYKGVYTRVLMSENALNNAKKLIVLIPDYGKRCWMWSVKNIFETSFEEGTMIAYVQYFLSKGYEIIISNPNENYFINGKPSYLNDFKNKKIDIPGHSDFNLHILNIFKDLIFPSSPENIYIIGYSFGGEAIIHLIKEQYLNVFQRIKKVALIHSVHSVNSLTDYEHRAWLASNVFNFMKSKKPKYDYLDEPRFGCNCISSGCTEAEDSIPYLKKDINILFNT